MIPDSSNYVQNLSPYPSRNKQINFTPLQEKHMYTYAIFRSKKSD